MKQRPRLLNCAVAALLTLTSPVLPGAPAAWAQIQAEPPAAEEIARLLERLADPAAERPHRIEQQILRAWSRSGSVTIDFLFQRGQAALQAGRTDEAIDHFSAAIDHDPDFAEAWNGRATAYFMANRLGQSLADIEEVLARNPQHFGALAGLGMILEQIDRPEQARAAFAASAAINPHQQSVQAAIARLDLALQGQAL